LARLKTRPTTGSNAQAGKHTLAEINSQPETWQRCFAVLDQSGELGGFDEMLPRHVEWVFVGCGSSFYLAQVAAATWSSLTGENARAMPASDVLLFPKLLPRACQPVLISRSGQTSEVLEAAAYFEREVSVKTLAITCGENTPIEEICSHLIKLKPADEKSTVMTRSFTSMLLALQALAAARSRRADIRDALRALPVQIGKRMDDAHSTIRSLAQSKTFADYVFLGQGPFFGVAQEAMLKVTEMSCSYAQSFHTLEFRHGPKAIVSPETLITFFLSDSGFREETAVLEEIKELGGATLVVTNKVNSAIRQYADYLLDLGLSLPEAAWPAAAVIPGQLLGFYLGMNKGFDPDRPRHLTRVVTLEGATDGGPNREP
jgi:glucosamine--fructose-6-phosphate aminotransferase (isomerizing)